MSATNVLAYRPPLIQHVIFAVYGLVIYAEIFGGAYLAVDKIGDEITRGRLERSTDNMLNNHDRKPRKGWERTVSMSRNWSGDYHVRASLVPPPGEVTSDLPPPIHLEFRTITKYQGEYTYLNYQFLSPGATPAQGTTRETVGNIIGPLFKRFGIFLLPVLLIGLFVLVVWAKLLNRAGYPGYYALLPGVNVFYVMTMAVRGLPKAWLLMLGMFMPGLNNIVWIFASLGLARNFGRSTGFAVGLILMPMFFLPVLAFGKAKYRPEAEGDSEE